MITARKRNIVITLGSFSFITAIAGTSVTLALPRIGTTFHVGSAVATLALQVGLITAIIFLVLFGHSGDIFSKSLVFKYGGWIFTAGTLFTGLAPSFALLLGGRVIQAIGIAMIMANTMGIINEFFDDQERAAVLAYNSMFISVGAIMGPAIGGIITSVLSWRWTFLIFVPFSLVTMWLGDRNLPTPKLNRQIVIREIKASNWLGQGLFTVGIITIFMSQFASLPGLSQIENYFFWLVLGSIITLSSFVQDSRAKSPWIAPTILKNRTFMASVFVLFIMMFVNSISNILLPFYFQDFLGFSAGKSGLLVATQSLVVMSMSPFIGRFANNKQRRLRLTAIGLTILTLAQIGYILYDGTPNVLLLGLPIVANGIGMGLAMTPNNALTMSFVDNQLAGVGGSMNSLFRNLGIALGTSFATSMLYTQLPGVKVISSSLGKLYLSASANVFIIGMIMAAFGIILNFVRPKD